MSKGRLLITGGAGFLGKRLALCLKDRYEVILGSRNQKLNAAATRFTGCETTPLDVSNLESVRDAVVRFQPEVIIHAAATKFVDLAEKHPHECVDVNVVGSQNVARVALEAGVKEVIGISTDKAAPPVRNTYGLSKAMMERVFCSLDGVSTRFCCVRYGNVAWSTGSVLPLWKQMIEEKGVIGTTGPEMRRFFFTVDEAVQLVETALVNMDLVHGKVLGRKMKAALIRDLLEVWTDLTNTRYEKIAGRPGERDDEFLVGELELPYTRSLELNGHEHFLISFNEKVEKGLPEVVSSANAERLNREEMEALLEKVPAEER